jgi:hypothetical protein
MAIGELPDELPLEVTGGGWDLITRSFGFGMSPLEIKLGDPSKGDFKITNTLRQAIAPKLDPVVINYILLDTLKFNIEIRKERLLEVYFDSSSVRLAPNYKLISPVALSPRMIKIFGPKSILDTIQNPYPIRIQDIEYSNIVSETVNLSELNTELIQTDFKKVELYFESVEFIPRSMKIDIRKINFGDEGIEIIPKTINVLYDWDSRVSSTSDTVGIKLRVDLKRVQSSDSTISIRVESTSPHISNIRLSTSRVKLKYE